MRDTCNSVHRFFSTSSSVSSRGFARHFPTPSSSHKARNCREALACLLSKSSFDMSLPLTLVFHTRRFHHFHPQTDHMSLHARGFKRHSPKQSGSETGTRAGLSTVCVPSLFIVCDSAASSSSCNCPTIHRVLIVEWVPTYVQSNPCCWL